MLEKVDLSKAVSTSTYGRRLPELQDRLYDLERAVSELEIPVALVFEGWSAAGKGGAIRALTQRLDPRGCTVVPVSPPRTHETHYPWMWRFWQKIPARGQIVVFDTSWYRRVLIERIEGTVRKRAWRAAYQDITEFEEQLAADGTLILKFWMHIDRKEQARRLKALLGDKLSRDLVTDEDRAQHRKYGSYLQAVEEMLVRTDRSHAPWVIVEAHDRQYARLRILDRTAGALEAVVDARRPSAPVSRRTPRSSTRRSARA